MEKEKNQILKVSSKSNPGSIAGAIAGKIKEDGKIEIQAIGAASVNQTIKAIAIARGFIAPSGFDLICIPSFTNIEMEDENDVRTGIRLLVKTVKID